MTASAAPNQTRLPRAIVRQSAAIAARYAPAETEIVDPADGTAAPAATPAAPPATTSATPAAPAADPRDSDPNYWKQRFNVTSGILAKERADWKAERDALKRKQAETAPASHAVPDAVIDLSKFYTPEQIEQYGEEQCRVMAKTAMDAARATAQDLIDAAVQPLREQREQEVADRAKDVKDKFYAKLAELHPSYAEDDVNPLWADEHTGWLAQEDENGVVRQQLLNIHLQNYDAPKVAKMFKAWKASIAAPAVPTPPVTPSGNGAAPAGDGAAPSARQVEGLTVPTDAEVKDYYKRSAIGKVKDDERVAFEARLKLRQRA